MSTAIFTPRNSTRLTIASSLSYHYLIPPISCLRNTHKIEPRATIYVPTLLMYISTIRHVNLIFYFIPPYFVSTLLKSKEIITQRQEEESLVSLDSFIIYLLTPHTLT